MNNENGEDASAAKERFLESVYFDTLNPGSYSGIVKLWQVVKDNNRYNLKYEQVRDWLEKQETYLRHKRAGGRFPRQKI